MFKGFFAVAAAIILLIGSGAWAQADRSSTFDIAAQPLAQALTAFGRQSGTQIAVDTASVAGKTSNAVKGSTLR